MGIAIMLGGIGTAFFFGKPYIQPSAPQLPAIPLGGWSSSPQLRNALDVSPLFFLGLSVGVAMTWGFRNTRLGLIVRIVGDSADSARAMGLPINLVRLGATAAGSALAGIGGAFPVARLPRQLERRLVVGPRSHRRGPGGIRALEPAELHRRRAPLRRRRRARPVAAIGRDFTGILSLQCRALRADAVSHDGVRAAGTVAERRPR